jgi:hypothetical protein
MCMAMVNGQWYRVRDQEAGRRRGLDEAGVGDKERLEAVVAGEQVVP